MLGYKVSKAKQVSNINFSQEIFNIKTGCNFTPENFRNFRLNKLDNCHGMIIIRTDVSESTAFELGYSYAKYKIPIKTIKDHGMPNR